MLKKRIIFLLFISIIFASLPSVAGENSVNVKEILWWLPVNSETLTVVRGPFKVADLAVSSRKNLEFMLQAYGVRPLGSLRHGEVIKRFVDVQVVLSVEGSRHFRAPSSLGGMRYDGCHILVFDNNIMPFFNSISDPAALSLSFEQNGFKVLVFKEHLEADDWLFYVVAPRPNILIISTEKSYLQDVLKRMNTQSGERAFNDNLPEWHYINRQATCWALRHYSSLTASEDPSTPLTLIKRAANNPDPKAIGFVFQYSSGDSAAKMTYLSNDENSVDKVRSFWTSKEGNLTPIVEPLPKDGASITVPIANLQQAGYFLFILMAVLGHAVFV